MRTAKVISISLPPDMNNDIQELAREERRSVSELMREALRQYIALNTWKKAQKQARKAAKRKNIQLEDIEHIIDEGRK
ncbi:MAG: ribbon-helix-helix protein, CopG family [Deltaproteobacteria bacterium]|nr:ribbon-helix-helix protein, CopG family [Deltaproteobacteria bacterium]